MSRLSATTAFAPPGPRRLAIVVSRWRRSVSRSFIAVQGRGRCNQGQDYPSHRLRGENHEFASDSLPVCAFYVSGTPGASFPSILLRTSRARNSEKGSIFWSTLADSSAAIYSLRRSTGMIVHG